MNSAFGINVAPFNCEKQLDGSFRIADAADNALARAHLEENARLICAALNFYYLTAAEFTTGD